MSIMFALLLAPAVQPVTFPEAFHGVWDGNLEACAAPGNDGRIAIDAKGIHFWESDGVPVSLHSPKSKSAFDENDVHVTLAMSGEGEEWKMRSRFVLNQSGELLFTESLPVSGEEYIHTRWFYVKCPDGTKQRQ